tara:strand:- start:1203 stop:1754 length:552 start_codon:yes stop_codon:yes gene_type:complete
MATVVLRPSVTASHTGWTADPLVAASDGDTTTSVVQSNRTCNWTATLTDLDSSLSGATINSLVISANAKAGRAGACTAVMSLVHSSDGEFAAETESWTGTQTTQTTSSRTTQQDGSSALTYAYINNCSIKIIPNIQGITLYELYITVDYTEAGYGNKIFGIAAASIGKIIGRTKSTIDKMVGK